MAAISIHMYTIQLYLNAYTIIILHVNKTYKTNTLPLLSVPLYVH